MNQELAQKKALADAEKEATRVALAQKNKSAANAMLLRMLKGTNLSALSAEVDHITVGVTCYE